MRLAKTLRSSRLILAAPVLVILASGTTAVHAQRPISPAREAVRVIQQKDMEEQLNLKLLPAKREDNVARQLALDSEVVGEHVRRLVVR